MALLLPEVLPVACGMAIRNPRVTENVVDFVTGYVDPNTPIGDNSFFEYLGSFVGTFGDRAF
jgi:hypothetical protein